MPKIRSVLRSRRLVVAIAATVAVGAVGAVASAGGSDAGAKAPSGPTAAATVRDLVTTLEETGVVERVDQRTISYAAALPAPAATPVAGAGTGTSATGTAPGGTPAPGTAPATGRAAPATTTTTTTTTPAPTAVDPAGDAPTTGDPPDRDVPATTTSTTTAPEDPASPSTTSTTTTPAESPRPSTTTTSTTTTTTSTSSSNNTTTTTTTTTTSPAQSGGGSGQPGSASTDATTEETLTTLTGMLAVGADATRGAVLYTADDQPTVALFGTIPMWRTLEAGVDAGADVRQLEENLVALGYGSGVTVDNIFSAATTSAVKRWETALGRAAPDGTVDLGDVVYLAGAGAVLSHDATIGEPLDTGTPVLTVGSEEQIVSADVPADQAAGWSPGATVDLDWTDGSTSPGTVSAMSSDVVDGNVKLTVALAGADRGRPNGAEATVTAVDVRHDGVVAVPVAAIVAGTDGGRAVRVAAGGDADRLTPVQTGLVAGGWIEITSGLQAGEPVRLPG